MNISVTLIHFTFNSDIKFLTYFVLIMHANLLSRRAVRMKSIRLNQQSACLETYHMQVTPLSVRFILIPCMAAAHSVRWFMNTPWIAPLADETRESSPISTQRALRRICSAWDLRPDKSKFRPRPLPAASCRLASLPVATTATHGAAAQRKQLSGLAMELDKVCQAKLSQYALRTWGQWRREGGEFH